MVGILATRIAAAALLCKPASKLDRSAPTVLGNTVTIKHGKRPRWMKDALKRACARERDPLAQAIA